MHTVVAARPSVTVVAVDSNTLPVPLVVVMSPPFTAMSPERVRLPVNGVWITSTQEDHALPDQTRVNHLLVVSVWSVIRKRSLPEPLAPV